MRIRTRLGGARGSTLGPMAAARNAAEIPAGSDFLAAFEDVSAAVEAGAGLPEGARATGRAPGARVAIVDSARSGLAGGRGSPPDAGGGGSRAGGRGGGRPRAGGTGRGPPRAPGATPT